MRRITKIEPTEPILPRRKRVADFWLVFFNEHCINLTIFILGNQPVTEHLPGDAHSCLIHHFILKVHAAHSQIIL